jgi:hypothetical protein
MTAMGVVEFFLWAVLTLFFREKGFHRRFRATCAFVELRAITSPLLLGIVRMEATTWGAEHHLRLLHIAFCFAAYIACTVLVFFVCIEAFCSALAAFPGIANLAIILFRWAAVVSVIVSLASISWTNGGLSNPAGIFYSVTRPVSALELCLPVFACLSMKGLKLPAHNMAFGIALGLGVVLASDFVVASSIAQTPSISSPVRFFSESLMFAGIGLWITYCVAPEPAPKLALMPANSIIYRWNEIAMVLGYTGTRVVVHRPEDGCFLSDVERIAEEALARNMGKFQSGA